MSSASDSVQQRASACLQQAWMRGEKITQLAPELAPRTKQEALAIQAQIERMSAKPVYGWKIAATSLAGQRHIGVDGPLAGRLLSERVRAPGAHIALQGNAMRVAECEFAFRLKLDLPARPASAYSQEEVMQAVASLHLAIEIPDSRFRDFEHCGHLNLIADNACAHDVLVGPACTANWRVLDLSTHAVTASLETPGQAPRHSHGVGSNVLGDPRNALTWLANELASQGAGLRAGQTVITGTCVTPIAIQPGEQVRANFGALGEIHASF